MIIKQASPNGHRVRLIECDGSYSVEEHIDGWWEPGQDYDTLAEAEVTFEGLCAELRQTPNWEAQARYDEEHGTDNGYDPDIEAFRREW